MKTAKELLENVRMEAVKKIKYFLFFANEDRLYISDFSPSESPVVHKDFSDDNNTYTLDEIERDKCGDIIFSSSSSCGNTIDMVSDLDTDTLIGIVDWLEGKKDAILDYYCEEFTAAQREAVADIISEQLTTAIPDEQTRSAVAERLLPNVLERISTDADWSELEDDEVVDGDVEIALENELAWLVLEALDD